MIIFKCQPNYWATAARSLLLLTFEWAQQEIVCVLGLAWPDHALLHAHISGHCAVPRRAGDVWPVFVSCACMFHGASMFHQSSTWLGTTLANQQEKRKTEPNRSLFRVLSSRPICEFRFNFGNAFVWFVCVCLVAHTECDLSKLELPGLHWLGQRAQA